MDHQPKNHLEFLQRVDSWAPRRPTQPGPLRKLSWNQSSPLPGDPDVHKHVSLSGYISASQKCTHDLRILLNANSALLGLARWTENPPPGMLLQVCRLYAESQALDNFKNLMPAPTP